MSPAPLGEIYPGQRKCDAIDVAMQQAHPQHKSPEESGHALSLALTGRFRRDIVTFYRYLIDNTWRGTRCLRRKAGEEEYV